MTESRAAYVAAIPIISAPALIRLILAAVPIVGVLGSERRDGREVCTATPADFKFWALKAAWVKTARAKRRAKHATNL